MSAIFGISPSSLAAEQMGASVEPLFRLWLSQRGSKLREEEVSRR